MPVSTPTTRILGLDPGSRFTGFGVIDKSGNRLTHVASGRVVAGNGPLAERLEIIYRALIDLIATHRPEVAAIEGIFHHRNAESALKLGHARGVALLACRMQAISVEEYAPAEVKLATVGNGRAEKEQVQQMVRMLLGLGQRALSLDESDALAIAICQAQRNPHPALRRA